MCDNNNNESERPAWGSYYEEVRRLGLVGPDEFICIAQDIPPYMEIPVTD